MLYEIKTWEAAIKYGKGTKWCVSSKITSKWFDMYTNEENKKLPSVDKSEKDDKKVSLKTEDKKVDDKKDVEKTKTDKPIKSEEKNKEKENKNN